MGRMTTSSTLLGAASTTTLPPRTRALNNRPSDSFLLAPRHIQTLCLLLAGQSEKEVATELALSQHTVHNYVKTIYRRFEVSSRGELLAQFFWGGTLAQLMRALAQAPGARSVRIEQVGRTNG
jgi:DNA-binding CsgD family transcriptional regulator